MEIIFVWRRWIMDKTDKIEFIVWEDFIDKLKGLNNPVFFIGSGFYNLREFNKMGIKVGYKGEVIFIEPQTLTLFGGGCFNIKVGGKLNLTLVYERVEFKGKEMV
jgi:hypothetical protein